MKRSNLYISVLSIVLLFGISAVSATAGIFDQQADSVRCTNKVPAARRSNGVYTLKKW